MTKSLITKVIGIPSILIDLNFIQNVGKIIERQVDERKEKEGKPHINVKYIFNTKDDQEIEFSSLQEILDRTLSLQKISSFVAYVYHYNGDYVDIYIKIDKPITAFFITVPNNYLLSSKDEGSLLRIERELKDLFNESRLKYHYFFYPQSNISNICVFIISVFASVGFCQLLFKGEIFKSLNAIYPLVIYYLIVEGIIKWLFPFYEFELTRKKDFVAIFRVFLGVIFMGLATEGIIEIIKFLYHISSVA